MKSSQQKTRADRWADGVMSILEGRQVVGISFDGGNTFMPQRMEVTLDNGQKLVIRSRPGHCLGVECDQFELL